ncbi:MAG: non-canonical purine NTP pyrophosphatase [Rubrobacter sp.]
MKAIFVTTNEHKRREVQEILGFELEGAALGPGEAPEIQSLDFEEVAAAKALAASEALGRPSNPVLVEDSGLVVGAWGGLPGPLTKLFLSAVGNEGLLRMLAAEEDRSALAVCAVAVAEAGGGVRVFRGEVAGTVAHEGRGEGGFGYDAVFVPDGGSLTYAELGAHKNADSHRARAFRAVGKWLGEG